MTPMDMLAARIGRLESLHEIGQLPVRYAQAIDARDIDAWLALFVEDVDCGARGRGREALRGFIEPAVATFYRSVHMICGHTIELADPAHATGRVYSRCEHEMDGQWIVQATCYHDTYERRDGVWYFARREEDFFYSCNVLERPQDAGFARWPGPAPKHAPPMMLPRFPTWPRFWGARTPPTKDAVHG